MRNTWFRYALAMTVILLPLASFVAYAQESGVSHPPSGVSYEFRYTISDARTTSVCLHEVDSTGALLNPVGGATSPIDAADAIVCTTTFVADGTTVNRITHQFTPPLTAQKRVALRGYDGPSVLPSQPSNWHVLVLQLTAPVLLD